jgi:hypothetical protein
MANQKIPVLNELPLQPRRNQLSPKYIDAVMNYRIAQRAKNRGLGTVMAADNDATISPFNSQGYGFNGNDVDEYALQQQDFNELNNFYSLPFEKQYELTTDYDGMRREQEDPFLEDQSLDMAGAIRALSAAKGLGIILDKGRNRTLEVAKRSANKIGKAIGSELVGNAAWAAGEDTIDNW